MQDTTDGADIVNKYYNIAPTIVKRISKESNSSAIYQEILETYLNPCIHLIEKNEKLKSKDIYIHMVEELATKYLH